jgi:hypothetical protein
MTLSISDSQQNDSLHYAESGCTECGILFTVMLSVVMLDVIMLSAVASRDNAELLIKTKKVNNFKNLILIHSTIIL